MSLIRWRRQYCSDDNCHVYSFYLSISAVLFLLLCSFLAKGNNPSGQVVRMYVSKQHRFICEECPERNENNGRLNLNRGAYRQVQNPNTSPPFCTV